MVSLKTRLDHFDRLTFVEKRFLVERGRGPALEALAVSDLKTGQFFKIITRHGESYIFEMTHPLKKKALVLYFKGPPSRLKHFKPNLFWGECTLDPVVDLREDEYVFWWDYSPAEVRVFKPHILYVITDEYPSGRRRPACSRR